MGHHHSSDFIKQCFFNKLTLEAAAKVSMREKGYVKRKHFFQNQLKVYPYGFNQSQSSYTIPTCLHQKLIQIITVW